jgi:hypothetical protein
MRSRLIAVGLVLVACSHPHAKQNLQPQPPEATQASAPAEGAEAEATPPTPPVATPSTGGDAAAAASQAAAVTQPSAAIDFARDVRPIMEARCQPCHFTGGKMYERLPFDKPETIRDLGERLFTRIKAENEQAVIRQFLAQAP